MSLPAARGLRPRWKPIRVGLVLALATTGAFTATSGTAVRAASTYSEQVGRYGVNTFMNYHNASGQGPHIDAYSTVQVTCKVLDGTIQSTNPDGYWYRIASSPWNNGYYSPANTFYNGDPMGGPYTHNTDFNVPNCSDVSSGPAPQQPPTASCSGGVCDEQVGKYGVDTFTSYHNASGVGPHIAAFSHVSVSCKVLDGTIASSNPDGYWYRIASSPWNNGYYSPANTFYNGDPTGGPYVHNVDASVPDCGGAGGPGPGVGTTPGQPGSPPAVRTTTPLPPTGDLPIPDPTDRPKPLQPYNQKAAVRLRAGAELREIKAFRGFLYTAGFNNAADDVNHYLDSSGTPISINMATLINALPGLKGQYQYWLRDNVQKALNVVKASPANVSAIQSWDTAGITNNWAPFNANDSSSDWRWALGHFSVRMRGKVWIGTADATGDRPVVLQYRSYMFDVYNFGGALEELQDLANNGYAAEFLETGNTVTVTVKTSVKFLNANQLQLRY